MKRTSRGVALSLFCAACGAAGCASFFDDEVTYNPYVRNGGEKPVLRAADDVISAPEKAMNELDRRFERVAY